MFDQQHPQDTCMASSLVGTTTTAKTPSVLANGGDRIS